eukprot:CAMPEP_0175199894 /NCGR_PEP_ID=MMETSP0093-20121207/9263_1 /TAXON_ID=311494 /ORGANISM="Alexandrium monilatum, Strain CCMP3105" /LENGTH=206 /DNA_ID=CAMNT_0016492903 /DNA_START=934 /DNA_END=1550 /DNA_ORIENTATION=-
MRIQICEAQQDVHLLQADPVHSAEDGAHVDKDREVPHGPVEVQDQPENQEERLPVREAVRAHRAGVVEAVQEGQGGPAAAARNGQEVELQRTPRCIKRPAGHVQHLPRRQERRGVAHDDDANEDGADIVQDAVLGGRAARELPHLPQTVQLHDRLRPVSALLGLGQRLLVDLAVGQAREVLESLEVVGTMYATKRALQWSLSVAGT